MKTINELHDLVEQAINQQVIASKRQPEKLYEPIHYILSIGGKRLRPIILLMGTNVFTNQLQKALPAALSIEVFHNFTLLHDDIMDNSPLRRGKPTVHQKWDNNTAILSGDAMSIVAYQLLSQTEPDKLPSVLEVFNNTALQVCEGQQYDMDFETRHDVGIAEYIEMIRLKTSVLIAGALKMGALIAGASNKQADALYSFGENLGISFQLKDDWLDVFGDPEKFGKKPGGDIVANKKTFLLLKAKELATETDANQLNHWINLKVFDREEKIQAITALYKKLKIDQLSEEITQQYYNKAIMALDNLDVESEKKQELYKFASWLFNRQK